MNGRNRLNSSDKHLYPHLEPHSDRQTSWLLNPNPAGLLDRSWQPYPESSPPRSPACSSIKSGQAKVTFSNGPKSLLRTAPWTSFKPKNLPGLGESSL